MLGVLMALLFALHGWTFLAWRAPGMFGASRPGWALLLTGLPAAPPVTLNVLSLMVPPFAPLMLGAQVWVWRTFRPGKDAVRIPSFF
jgi:cytochrome d ubiquinol oxidase subunit II